MCTASVARGHLWLFVARPHCRSSQAHSTQRASLPWLKTLTRQKTYYRYPTRTCVIICTIMRAMMKAGARVMRERVSYSNKRTILKSNWCSEIRHSFRGWYIKVGLRLRIATPILPEILLSSWRYWWPNIIWLNKLRVIIILDFWHGQSYRR